GRRSPATRCATTPPISNAKSRTRSSPRARSTRGQASAIRPCGACWASSTKYAHTASTTWRRSRSPSANSARSPEPGVAFGPRTTSCSRSASGEDDGEDERVGEHVGGDADAEPSAPYRDPTHHDTEDRGAREVHDVEQPKAWREVVHAERERLQSDRRVRADGGGQAAQQQSAEHHLFDDRRNEDADAHPHDERRTGNRVDGVLVARR